MATVVIDGAEQHGVIWLESGKPIATPVGGKLGRHIGVAFLGNRHEFHVSELPNDHDSPP